MTINATARRMLAIREIAYDHDFLHTARGMPCHDVRNAIDLAFREHTTSTLKDVELDRTAGNGRYVELTTTAVPVKAGSSELGVISIVDTTENVRVTERLG